MNTCDPLGGWSHACLISENLSHPVNLSVSVYYVEVGGKAKNVMQFLQLLVPCDHFSEPEALPAENLDPRALGDTWCWNPLDRFPGGWMLGLISFNCFINDLKRVDTSP